PDPDVTLPNGSFENLNGAGDQFTGWSFYDGPKQSVFVDHSVYHSGNTSARCTNFNAGNPYGNCRFERGMSCQPNHYYYLSAWCKTQDLASGTIQLVAIGSKDSLSQGLTYTQFSVPPTSNGWVKLQICFNTLQYTQVSLYCGLWGPASTGTIWWDDFQVQEAGLVNVLRRPGAPIKVWNKNSGTVYTEGVDYAPIVDSVMLNNQGSYPYHTPVTFRRLPGGNITNGDTLMISFFHPLTVYSDNNQNGSVMVCLSEDTLYSILNHQISGVDSLYHPQDFFLSHDEIRNMNRDSSCLKRGMTPAQLLDDNVSRCSQIVKNVEPNAKQYIWSDMFDSLHNAYNNYYFVNGDLTGDWNNLSRSLTIVNWNSVRSLQSMQRFASMGFSQITSPYYDVNDTVNIRRWNVTMRHVPNVSGEMYTTWTGNYSLLAPFADYAWNSAPYIFHTPVDVTDTAFFANPVITALVYPDAVNDSDAIVNVVVGHTTCNSDSIIYDTLRTTSKNNYSGTLRGIISGCNGFHYFIESTNTQDITRRVPISNGFYTVGAPVASRVSDVTVIPSTEALANYPNPFSSVTQLSVRMTNVWDMKESTLKVYNIYGAEVADLSGNLRTGGNAAITFDASRFPAGVYYAIFRTPEQTVRSQKMIFIK
ncbi:MAG TPA: T9SS type A sorting domain-containing protein, partial [Candidatus Kapabacteria bacterium]|nr:T9SS type A sorting domain-containing protein [Candidatus Kapabacteria bacterium]